MPSKRSGSAARSKSASVSTGEGEGHTRRVPLGAEGDNRPASERDQDPVEDWHCQIRSWLDLNGADDKCRYSVLGLSEYEQRALVAHGHVTNVGNTSAVIWSRHTELVAGNKLLVDPRNTRICPWCGVGNPRDAKSCYKGCDRRFLSSVKEENQP